MFEPVLRIAGFPIDFPCLEASLDLRCKVEGAPRRLSSMDDWPTRQSWDLPLGRLALGVALRWRVMALRWGMVESSRGDGLVVAVGW